MTDHEPHPADHVLWDLPNVIITPHYSGAHLGYAERVTGIFRENLARHQRGDQLVNLVDKAAGY